MRKSLRVLHLISSGGFYGAENMVIQLAVALKRLNCEVVIGVFHNRHRPNTEIVEIARLHGLEVVLFECRGKLDFGTVRAIRNFISEREFDILHTHGYKANIYGYRAAKSTRASLVATAHSWPGKSPILRLYALLDGLMLRSFDHICVVSNSVADALRRFHVPSEKITIVDNGIDTRAFTCAVPTETIRTNQPGEIVVGLVGRLVLEKGCEVLLRASVKITSEFPGVRIVYVGDGPERVSLEQHAHELGLDRNVYFAGKRQDMPGVYAAFDICVLPSLGEGMPMAILEAMAAAKAVIATRVGEIPKLVVHEETGLLVTPNQVGELRDALLRLLRDSNLRQKMGQKGAARVRQLFSLERMTKSYLELYRKLMDDPVLSDTTAILRENQQTHSR